MVFLFAFCRAPILTKSAFPVTNASRRNPNENRRGIVPKKDRRRSIKVDAQELADIERGRADRQQQERLKTSANRRAALSKEFSESILDQKLAFLEKACVDPALEPDDLTRLIKEAFGDREGIRSVDLSSKYRHLKLFLKKDEKRREEERRREAARDRGHGLPGDFGGGF